MTYPAALPDPAEALAGRWRGIRRVVAWCLAVGAGIGGVGWLGGWVRVGLCGAGIAFAGLLDGAVRGVRTLRHGALVRHPPALHPVRVTRHYRYRPKLPDLSYAGLWPPDGPVGEVPPLVVRVEDLAAFADGGPALALGHLAPRRWVVLVAGDAVVWPVRRVRRRLPRWMGPYPFEEDENDD